MNSVELKTIVDLAKEQNLILAQAMTIQLNFGSYKEYDIFNRFFNLSLAGGALLDIEAYTLSFGRWFMSEALRQIALQVKLAPIRVDEQAGIFL